MSFFVRDLSVLAYAQGFTLWHYASRLDELDAVSAEGFFDPASDLMTGGDMVLVSAPDGGYVGLVQPRAGHLITAPLSAGVI